MTAYIDEVEVFESDDGKRFFNERDCVEYEKNKAFTEKRKEYLTQEINKLFEPHALVFEIYSLNSDNSNDYILDGNENCLIYLKDDEGKLEECDENLWISMEEFDTLRYEIHYKYGFHINEPLDYWSK